MYYRPGGLEDFPEFHERGPDFFPWLITQLNYSTSYRRIVQWAVLEGFRCHWKVPPNLRV